MSKSGFSKCEGEAPNKLLKSSHSSRRQFLKEVAAATVISASGTAPLATAQQPREDAAADKTSVKSVRYLGEQFRMNQVGITGADGATSIVLPSGESLWMFGDTVEGPF